MTNLDNAIEAAAEALRPMRGGIVSDERYLARIAVEAAAPHLEDKDVLADLEHQRVRARIAGQRAEKAEARAEYLEKVLHIANDERDTQYQRAEKAEAEMERLQAERSVIHECCVDVQSERALADRLAEAIRPYVENTVPSIRAAYAAYEEARRNG